MNKRRKIVEVKNAVECKIVRRLNRFVVEIMVNGKTYKAYTNNTGRLKNYIVKGKTGFCIRKRGKEINYRLFSISEDHLGVIIDTQLQMKVFEELLNKSLIPWLKGCVVLSRNVKLGNSLIDYLLDCNTEKIYLEVKSAVMKYNNYATYPDCTSLRGRKHVKELINHVRNGGKAIILFISAVPKVKAFIPNCFVDKNLCELILKANKIGVEIRSIGIYYDPMDSFIYLFNPDLPVILEFEKFIEHLTVQGIKEFNKYRSPPRHPLMILEFSLKKLD